MDVEEEKQIASEPILERLTGAFQEHDVSVRMRMKVKIV
jgi:hypothetical protein